jgi:ribonuclease R
VGSSPTSGTISQETLLKERLLRTISAARRPIPLRELVRTLDLERTERKELRTVLREMIDAGEIVKTRGGRVGLPSRMDLVAGRLVCSPGGFGFVRPERQGPKQPDVFVAAANLGEALHGDLVVARVERRAPKGPEGRIIRILERAVQRVVGRYEDDGAFGGHVVPFDRRILHEVFVPPGHDGGAASGEMVTAEITRPPAASRNPAGRVLSVLGRIEQPGVDLAVVVAKHGLPERFPDEVEAEAARIPTSVRPEETSRRTDFRSWPTVTVDPESARDHDDAISLEPRPGGGWRLGVHIADVAHYVREGSSLDQEAYLRGTSVYFPGRVVPMLPHALSSRICSLVEGEDRLSQSVVLDLAADGRVHQTEFHDGVIRSAARLTYAQAQAIVDGDPGARAAFAPVVGLVVEMDSVAKILSRRRHERGSLDLDLPEPELLLGPDGELTEIRPARRLDSMRAIEELMLLANEAVAERLSDAAAPALFRIHEAPDPERVDEFCELVASFGYRLPANREAIEPQHFQRILRQLEGKPEAKLVSSLLLRTLRLARYYEENLGHFGLATEQYAHFTSPIRRYPDLVVHRALRRLRRGGAADDALREALPEMGRHLSAMERRADEAERELIEWKKVRYMAGKVGETFPAYVTGVRAFGLFVELSQLYVPGLVHVSSMADDYYHFDERAHTLTGENTRTAYRLGDPVEVKVARVDLEARQIDLVLVDVLRRLASGARKTPGPKPRRVSRRGAPRPRRGRR